MGHGSEMKGRVVTTLDMIERVHVLEIELFIEREKVKELSEQVSEMKQRLEVYENPRP